jgi:hypothetical protein
MQLLAVKHNHLTVSRAIEAERDIIPHLMDLDGRIKTAKVPKVPHEPSFFDTIKVPDLPAPPGSKLGFWCLPKPDMAPISDAHRDRRLKITIRQLQLSPSEEDEEDDNDDMEEVGVPEISRQQWRVRRV